MSGWAAHLLIAEECAGRGLWSEGAPRADLLGQGSSAAAGSSSRDRLRVSGNTREQERIRMSKRTNCSSKRSHLSHPWELKRLSHSTDVPAALSAHLSSATAGTGGTGSPGAELSRASACTQEEQTHVAWERWSLRGEGSRWGEAGVALAGWLSPGPLAKGEEFRGGSPLDREEV